LRLGAVGRQLDQVDTASRSRPKSPDFQPFVVGGVVPDDMNDALVRVALLDLGQKLDGTDPINGCGFDKRGIKSFEAHSPMNIHTTAPRSADNHRI